MEPPTRETAELLQRLYGAATCSVEWHDFLRDYAAQFEADGVVMFDVGDEREKIPALAACYGFRNDLMPLWRNLALGPARETETKEHDHSYLCESTRYDESALDPQVFLQVLEPAGLTACYCLRLVTSLSPDRFRCVTAMRRHEAGPFTDSDLQHASMLAPHIDRAMTLYAANSQRDLERTAALSTLEWFGIGIAIVVEHATIRYLNDEARRIFALDDGISMSGNRIHCSDPAAERQLEDQIRQAIDGFSNGEPTGDRPVRIERKSGLSPFALFVVRAPQLNESLTPGAGSATFASVLISNPERPVLLPPLALRKLYGITPAESRVLEGIISGSTVTEMAEKLDVTANTIRAHLKHIYKITHTKNQADLIRRVMLDIAWMKTASRRDD